jgi:hypothetical protein
VKTRQPKTSILPPERLSDFQELEGDRIALSGCVKVRPSGCPGKFQRLSGVGKIMKNDLEEVILCSLPCAVLRKTGVLAGFSDGVTWLKMARGRTELINTVRYVAIHYLGQGCANGRVACILRTARGRVGHILPSWDPPPRLQAANVTKCQLWPRHSSSG